MRGTDLTLNRDLGMVHVAIIFLKQVGNTCDAIIQVV